MVPRMVPIPRKLHWYLGSRVRYIHPLGTVRNRPEGLSLARGNESTVRLLSLFKLLILFNVLVYSCETILPDCGNTNADLYQRFSSSWYNILGIELRIVIHIPEVTLLQTVDPNVT
jgi:hypothetical protein